MIFMIINKNTVNIPFLSISLSRKTLNVHFPTFLLSYFSLVFFWSLQNYFVLLRTIRNIVITASRNPVIP